MFWNGGHLYVYFTYGMHFCANIVTREEGTGEAVLIRAVEPLEGIEEMMRNRFDPVSERNPRTTHPAHPPFNLTNGPAKLCQALDLRREHNGTDLLGGEIYVLGKPRLPASDIGTSTRIGIVKGKEKKWRFFVKENRWISK